MGTLVDALAGALVGQISLSPALRVAQLKQEQHPLQNTSTSSGDIGENHRFLSLVMITKVTLRLFRSLSCLLGVALGLMVSIRGHKILNSGEI